jgi:hypothetical protein
MCAWSAVWEAFAGRGGAWYGYVLWPVICVWSGVRLGRACLDGTELDLRVGEGLVLAWSGHGWNWWHTWMFTW